MKMWLNSTLLLAPSRRCLQIPKLFNVVSNFGQSSESRLSKNTFNGRAGLRSRMLGIRQLVETKANDECCGALICEIDAPPLLGTVRRSKSFIEVT